MNGMGETDGSRAEAEQQREIEQLREAVRASDMTIGVIGFRSSWAAIETNS